jgi:hypothetical protein
MEKAHKPVDLRGKVFCAGPRDATVGPTIGSGALYLVFAEDLDLVALESTVLWLRQGNSSGTERKLIQCITALPINPVTNPNPVYSHPHTCPSMYLHLLQAAT